MSNLTIPLFPLHAVLFPGAPLPLRIFEPRYTDMISQCLKNGTGFGVCLIREGNEVGNAASTHEIGSMAEIVDWHMRQDGLLGIVVKGGKRFRIVKQFVESNQLLKAEVELLDDEEAVRVPPQFLDLVDILEERIAQLNDRFNRQETRYDDASWVGFRLAELLPLRLSQKQYFLQLDKPLDRLERISDVLQHLDLAI